MAHLRLVVALVLALTVAAPAARAHRTLQQAGGDPAAPAAPANSGGGGGLDLGGLFQSGFKAVGSLFGGGGDRYKAEQAAMDGTNATAVPTTSVTQSINSTFAGLGSAITTAVGAVLPGLHLNQTQPSNRSAIGFKTGGVNGTNANAASAPAAGAGGRALLAGAAGAAAILLLAA